MTDNKQKIKDKSNNGINTVVATVAGVVIGAGVVAMGNKKNQKSTQAVIDKVKEKASTYMKTAQDKIDERKLKLEKTAEIAEASNQKVKKLWQK